MEMDLTFRRTLVFIKIGLTLLSMSETVRADEALFKPLHSLSLRDPTPTKSYPQAYAASTEGATWNIVSWSIPGGNLPPFTVDASRKDQTYKSHANEAQVELRVFGASSELMLTQNGKFLPCETNGGKPRESDLFVHPNLKETEKERSAYLFDPNSSSLDSMSSLVVRGSVGLNISAIGSVACDVAQASVMVGVTLTNKISHQTFSYQLALAQGCGQQKAERERRCQSSHNAPKPHFFAMRNPFGADDSLPLLGKAFLANDVPEVIQIDILPRLIYFMHTGPADLDKHINHWHLQAFTFGQNIWGGMLVRSQWKDMNLYRS